MRTHQRCGVAVLTVLLTTSAALAEVSDPVRLDTGLISGVPGSRSGVRVFKGIPFAAPPVGPLRWREPRPPVAWEGIRKADEFGPRCMQGGGGNGRQGGAPVQPPVSEDCLYLNVWTGAASANERRPVILWSYGGSLTSGSGSQPLYDGEALAKKGVVFVTYNYRLGPFGFFAHPELTRESGHNASGNQGLMDLRAALEWIQKNIARFGGDPTRVTSMGESAGASLVACLVVSPRAKGLFQRAIAESTGCTGTSRIGLPMMTLAEAEGAGTKAARALGAESLADLRAKPAAEVLKNATGTRVIVDGWNLVEDAATALAERRQHDVDVLVGSNKDEGTFPVFGVPSGTPQQFIDRTRARYGAMADSFLALYPAGSESESNASQLASFRDMVFWNLRSWAQQQSTRGRAKAYVYYFTHEPQTAPGQPSRGASHTAEIPYAFNNAAPGWTETDRRLADVMSSYWVNFAATGDPNGKGLPAWPAFKTGASEQPMVLGDTVGVAPGPGRAQLAFYDTAMRPSSQRR